MTTLYIVRGMPGSGKSTYAKTLSINHFEADDFFYKEGEYLFEPAGLKKAHDSCFINVELSLFDGQDVVVANTFTTLKEIQPYIDLADRYETNVQIVTCTGEYESIHEVPEHTIERMRQRFVSHEDVLQHFGL